MSRADGPKMDMSTEMAALVAAAQAGDKEAFNELVRVTYTDVYSLARRILRNEEDARDVVQDVYFRAFRSIKRFRGDAQFSTWLYRITANCSSTYMTKRARQDHDELNDETTPIAQHEDFDPQAKSSSAFESTQLSEALDSLPDTLRAVVVLRDIYDLSHEAIATELGISEGTAKVRLHRARLKLRERLAPMKGGGTAHAV